MYNKLRHSGCYGGTQEEVTQAYQAELRKKVAENFTFSSEEQVLKRENAKLELQLTKYEEAELESANQNDEAVDDEVHSETQLRGPMSY